MIFSALRKPFSVMLVEVSLISVIAGCYVYAPPVRVTHSTAPANLEKEQGEASISAAQIIYYEKPGIAGNMGYAFTDRIVIEGGLGGQVTQSAIGYGGIRFVPFPPNRQKFNPKLTLDLELGGGLGVGGRLENHSEDDDMDLSDDVPWHKRLAGGGYAGFGLGFRYKVFDCFLRARYQLSGAENIPMTQFESNLLAFQFSFESGFRFYVGGGYVAYWNERQMSGWSFAEIGLAGRWSSLKLQKK